MDEKRLAVAFVACAALFLFAIPAGATAAPDLSVENLTVAPYTFSTADNVTVTFDIHNFGNETVERAYFYFYVDDMQKYLLYYGARDFQPGASEHVRLLLHLRLAEGVHTACVVADAENTLAESDEQNNAATFNITVNGSMTPVQPEGPQTVVNLDLAAHDLQNGWSTQLVTIYHYDEAAEELGAAEDQTFPNEYNQPLGNFFFMVPTGYYYIERNMTCSDGKLFQWHTYISLRVGSNTANVDMPFDCSGPWTDHYVPPPTTTMTTTTTTLPPTTATTPPVTTTTAGCEIFCWLAALALVLVVMVKKTMKK